MKFWHLVLFIFGKVDLLARQQMFACLTPNNFDV